MLDGFGDEPPPRNGHRMHVASTGHATPLLGAAAAPGWRETHPVVLDEAYAFLELFHREQRGPNGTQALIRRRAAVRAEIEAGGTYRHTPLELEFGARVAWRNADRCIGRLYWQSLQIRDRREVREPRAVGAECVGHLRSATRSGQIRPTITVLAPDRPGVPGPRIHNDQLIGYAGWRHADGTWLGDGRYRVLTEQLIAWGWEPPATPGPFDVLPLAVSDGGRRPEVVELPRDAVLEIELEHPDHPEFAGLGLRWYAVPTISAMHLEIGGVRYPAAPFSGWYLGTEIGARDLTDPDRYDVLPRVAALFGVDPVHDPTMWRDRAQLEVMRAVHHSFARSGVTLSDHHTESQRFLRHVERERQAGRGCPTDWSWIVPPFSSGLTAVFHRYYDAPDPALRPAFVARDPAAGCPVVHHAHPAGAEPPAGA